jgi:hypothetical protein
MGKAGNITVPVMVITLIEAKKNSASPYAPYGRHMDMAH